MIDDSTRRKRKLAAELIEQMLNGTISAQAAIDKWPIDTEDTLLGQIQGLLLHYKDDDDIRAKDKRYAGWQENDFRQMIQELMNDAPEPKKSH